MAEPIEFWFSVASTYTYLSVLRIADVARCEGVTFIWRPFGVRAIMKEQNNIPFLGKPVKTAYMWRDIERRAARLGLRARVPAPYPLTAYDTAHHVVMVGFAEGWGEDYVRDTYRLWFGEGLEPGTEPSLSTALRAVGQDVTRVLAKAAEPAAAEALAAATDAAKARGVFGSPSFVTRGELFWGDDRMQDAIEWSRRGTLAV